MGRMGRGIGLPKGGSRQGWNPENWGGEWGRKEVRRLLQSATRGWAVGYSWGLWRCSLGSGGTKTVPESDRGRCSCHLAGTCAGWGAGLLCPSSPLSVSLSLPMDPPAPTAPFPSPCDPRPLHLPHSPLPGSRSFRGTPGSPSFQLAPTAKGCHSFHYPVTHTFPWAVTVWQPPL